MTLERCWPGRLSLLRGLTIQEEIVHKTQGLLREVLQIFALGNREEDELGSR